MKRPSRIRHISLATAILGVAVIAAPALARSGDDDQGNPPPKTTSDDPVAILVAELGARDFARREQAQERLLKLGLQALPALEAAAIRSDDPEIRVRSRDIISLIRFGVLDRDSERLRSLLEDTSPSEFWKLRSEFARLGESALPYLLERLRHISDPALQVKHLEAVGWIQSPQASATVLDVLEGALEDSSVSGKAVEVLGRLRDPMSVKPLISLLTRGGVEEVLRGKVAAALGSIGDPRAISPLIDMAREELARVRRSYSYPLQQVLHALGNLRNEATLDVLEAAAKDQHSSVRVAALSALARAGFPRSLSVVKTALHDPDTSVRRVAVRALGNLGGEAVIDEILTAWLEADRYVRYAVLVALRSLTNPKRLPVVAAAALQEDGLLRDEALRILEQTADLGTLDVLIRVLGSGASTPRALTALRAVSSPITTANHPGITPPPCASEDEEAEALEWQAWWSRTRSLLDPQIRPLHEPPGQLARPGLGAVSGAAPGGLR